MRGRILAALAAAALAAGACGGDGGEPPAGGGAGPVLPTDRLALPTYDLPRFEGLLASLEGAPVVVNIWASWCGPCRAEAPDLAAAAREYEGRVQFLGVDLQDAREPAREFILEFDWPYPSVFDPQGEIRDGLGYVGQPVTFIVDAAGETAFEWNGAITGDLLREEIEKVLA